MSHVMQGIFYAVKLNLFIQIVFWQVFYKTYKAVSFKRCLDSFYFALHQLLLYDPITELCFSNFLQMTLKTDPWEIRVCFSYSNALIYVVFVFNSDKVSR